tara:strand:- start:1235 stop:2227 length:993 start_codon:yes stop_codon:yes gene_type:complete
MKGKERKNNFIITQKAWNIMQQYAGIAHDKDKNEISGIACVKKVQHPVSDDMVWEIFDPVILKQENTSTTTELDGDALRDYYIKAAMKHGEVRFCWWHSHHTMAAFWSGTDLNEIKAWKNDSWSLALVINLYGEYKLNVSTWDPIEHTEDVPLEIIGDTLKPTKKQLKEYEELCSNKADIVHHHSYGGHQTYLWNKSFQGNNWITKSTTEDALTKSGELTWKNSDNLEEYAELFNIVIDEIDDIMTDFAAGAIDYKKYEEFIIAINLNLSKRNAKMKIRKFPKGSLLEKAATLFPIDHIKFDCKKTQEIYERSETIIDYNGLIGGNFYAN